MAADQINSGGGAVVEGNVNTSGGNFAVRDIIMNPTPPSNHTDEFWTLVIDQFKLPAIAVEVINPLLQVMETHHLQLISDDKRINKQTLAYCLAHALHQWRPALPVYEWRGSQDESPQRDASAQREEPAVEEIIKSLSGPAIVIFSEMHPRFLRTPSFPNFFGTLEQNEQYLLITTDVPCEFWRLGEDKSRLWLELPAENLYLPTYLGNQLQERLRQNQKWLPPVVSQEAIESGQLFAAGRLGLGNSAQQAHTSLEGIASALGSPANLDLFVERLCALKTGLDPKAVDKLIQETLKEEDSDKIKYLYDQLPQRDQQLLTVGLCLFGELYESQFFRALQRLIVGPWRHLFRNVEIIDYYHLEELQPLFTFSPHTLIGAEQGDRKLVADRKLENRYKEERWLLLEVVWATHRNHVRAALGELVRLVEESVLVRNHWQEEFLDPDKRRHLRATMSQVFGDLGLLSPALVEESLAQLASNPNWGVQLAAARALANWNTNNKGHNAPNQLFDLLSRWQKNNWRTGSPRSMSAPNIQTTVARTLHLMILDNLTDTLPPPFLGQVEDLLRSNGQGALAYFYQFILPRLFPKYAAQLQERWPPLTPDAAAPDSSENMAARIPVLMALVQRTEQSEQQQPLITWLLATLTAATEKAPDAVAAAVLHPHAPAKLGDLYKTLAQSPGFIPWLNQLLRHTTPQNQAQMFALFNHLYDQQKPPPPPKPAEEKNQSQKTFGTKIVAWFKPIKRRFIPDKLPARMATPIEWQLFTWLADKNQPAVIHQTILRFFTAMNARSETQQAVLQAKTPTPLSGQKVSPRLATWIDRGYRARVETLFPLAAGLRQTDEQALASTLRQWRTIRGNAEGVPDRVRKVGHLLTRALWFTSTNDGVRGRLRRWWKPALLMLIFLAGMLGVGILCANLPWDLVANIWGPLIR